VIVNGYGPPEPAAGVPVSVAVPFPLSVNVTPVGSAPVSDNVELGTPLVVTVKVPAWPTVKVVPAELVIPGA
jgi:protein involved in polysaccharide export with SLBB domain